MRNEITGFDLSAVHNVNKIRACCICGRFTDSVTGPAHDVNVLMKGPNGGLVRPAEGVIHARCLASLLPRETRKALDGSDVALLEKY